MSNRGKVILSIIGVVISTTLLAIGDILAENAIISPAFTIVLITISAVLLFAVVLYAVKIDYETGVYECRKCGHTFKPVFKAYFWGAHTLRARYLKCLKCKVKSWCKRKMS